MAAIADAQDFDRLTREQVQERLKAIQLAVKKTLFGVINELENKRIPLPDINKERARIETWCDAVVQAEGAMANPSSDEEFEVAKELVEQVLQKYPHLTEIRSEFQNLNDQEKKEHLYSVIDQMLEDFYFPRPRREDSSRLQGNSSSSLTVARILYLRF